MAQTKALDALEPFLALAKSATSTRAATDLAIRATSAPSTFVFAELLQTPQIQALNASPESQGYFKMLEGFSYGTYESYHETPSLPELNDAQLEKLRQLSLLTLARDRSNLSYEILQKKLGLSSPREVENLVISAVYAGLLDAMLDPARQVITVNSVSPLRDLSPGSLPLLTTTLNNWSGRCSSTLSQLEDQMASIREEAAARQLAKKTADEKARALMKEVAATEPKFESHVPREPPRAMGKDAAASSKVGPSSRETALRIMDIDEAVLLADDKTQRAGKRKM